MRWTRGRRTGSGSADAPDIGLRRVALVRVLVGRGGPRAEAVGLGHRLPRVVPISLGTARRLGVAGVPVFVRADQVEA